MKQNKVKLSYTKRDELLFKVNSSPIFWRKKAEELKYAGELIWPHAESTSNKIIESIMDRKIDFRKIEPNTFSIFMSLIGFSTECLFKATIIRDNPEYVSNGILSSKIRGHNLIELAKIAKIKLSQHEQIFCMQAYRSMVIESRYPIAKEAEPINGIFEAGGHCKEIFTNLYERLYPTLGQIYNVKNKWCEIQL